MSHRPALTGAQQRQDRVLSSGDRRAEHDARPPALPPALSPSLLPPLAPGAPGPLHRTSRPSRHLLRVECLVGTSPFVFHACPGRASRPVNVVPSRLDPGREPRAASGHAHSPSCSPVSPPEALLRLKPAPAAVRKFIRPPGPCPELLRTPIVSFFHHQTTRTGSDGPGPAVCVITAPARFSGPEASLRRRTTPEVKRSGMTGRLGEKAAGRQGESAAPRAAPPPSRGRQGCDCAPFKAFLQLRPCSLSDRSVGCDSTAAQWAKAL